MNKSIIQFFLQGEHQARCRDQGMKEPLCDPTGRLAKEFEAFTEFSGC